jgi:hypothetical protein
MPMQEQSIFLLFDLLIPIMFSSKLLLFALMCGETQVALRYCSAQNYFLIFSEKPAAKFLTLFFSPFHMSHFLFFICQER